VVAAVAAAAMVADRRSPAPWDVSLAGVAAMQLAVRTAFRRGMPPRFIAPVLVPLALLAGGALGRLWRVEVNPLRRGSVRPAHGPWGARPAAVILAAAAGVNLVNSYLLFRGQPRGDPAPPLAGEIVAEQFLPYRHAASLPAGSKVLLVGEAEAFYFPSGEVETAYATAFDAHPLAALAAKVEAGEITPAEAHARLRRRGVTHLWVSWRQVARLATTYCYPEPLAGSDVIDRLKRGEPPRITIIDEFARRRLITAVTDVELPPKEPAPERPPPPETTTRAVAPPAEPAGKRPWPLATIYTLAPVAPAASAAGR
jgi:hypothetical protein